MTGKKKIFISYKRNIEPDEPIALMVYKELLKKHDVFIDQSMLVGTKWAEYIEKQLRKCDYLISLISEASVNSEMVIAEIETAHHLQKQYGKPVILPVRLRYTGPLVYPLTAYLNPINYVLWESETDNSELIEQLELSIAGKKISSRKPIRSIYKKQKEIVEPSPSVTPVTLESPEGTMNPHSPFYINRRGDQIALDAIKRQGVTITIKGPRQVGKSSLLNYVAETAANNGKRIILLDFQLIEKETLLDAKSFYQHFCRWISHKLGAKDDVEKFWKIPLGNVQICSDYIEEKIVSHTIQPIVLAMDETERIFESKFRSDFFGMLRNWHNNRSSIAQWKLLDLALVTSTEPYQFVDDLNQSPFNVGEVIEMQDFTFNEVVELNKRHNSPLTSDETARLVQILGGHPYLTRRALYLVSSQRITPAELFSRASEERGPFGDHLRNYLFRLHNKEHLINGLKLVLKRNKCPDPEVYFRLRGAGLIREQEADRIVPRNGLYAEYFRKHLNG
jgi:hypothetical protein